MSHPPAPSPLSSLAAMGHIFQTAHRGAAATARARAEFTALVQRDPPAAIPTACALVRLILAQVPRLSTDTLRRHDHFLREACQAHAAVTQSDGLCVAVMQTVQRYHNAADRRVRLAVVRTLEGLLTLVDARDTSAERQDWLQAVAEVLKCRAHDTWAAVRESAVAAMGAVFQTGRRDCDVTQQLLALLCGDAAAEVRRGVLRAIAPRKEFLEGYFHAMVRCTRDAVARVRAEAWEALGRFPWRYIVAYATAKRVAMATRLSEGLRDGTGGVAMGCRAALLQSWLHRDGKDSCEAVLDALVSGLSFSAASTPASSMAAAMAPFEVICPELLRYVRRRHPERHFRLQVNDVHTAGLLMWRAECRQIVAAEEEAAEEAEEESRAGGLRGASYFARCTPSTKRANTNRDNNPNDDRTSRVNPSDTHTNPNQNNCKKTNYSVHDGENGLDRARADAETCDRNAAEAEAMVDAAAAADGADDVSLLLPLADFAAVLQDTVYAYARPDAAPQTVRFRHADDADHMLAILLSVLDIYDANAYLAHADDTTRQRLLRLLNFLLKVVPDDDPSLFVDDAVRAIKSLAARVPEEGTRSVTSALDALFRSLKLPQRFGLGFDDVEALGRKSRERQQELMRRRVLLSSSSSSSSSASGLDGASSRREYDALRAEMDRDDKFMLRMQLIVHAYLSHSRRGEEVPVFCSHVMALGRLGENHWSVKVAAVRSRGVHGLIRPETVHTFMPIILSDTTEYGAGTGREGVAVAAIGVVFDLIMEYGLRFFDTPSSTRGSHGATSSAAAVTMISTMHTNQNNNNNNNNSSSNNNNNNNTNSSNNDSNNNNYHDTDTNTDGRANRAIGTHEDRNVSHAPSPYSAPNEDGHAGDDDDGARRDADPASAIPSAGESLPVRHALGVRLHREQELAEEDVHKVGIRHLLRTLLSYMRPAETTRTPVTLLGFCKLLSCNRLPHDQVPLVLARLMLHYTRILHLHHEAPTLSAYLTDMLDRFFRSYAASHPRRQLAMANGGMAACQLVLAERHTSWALKLMEYVTRVTDAFALTHIRDIDPEIARRVHRTTALDESSMHTSACAASTNVSGTCTSTTTSCNNNHNNNNNNESNREDTGDEDTAQARSNRTSLSRTLRKSDSQHRTANRVAVARLSLQSGRLMRELSCYSLHELLAQELLLEMSENEDVGCGAVCMSVLERHMYFYSKEVQPGLIDATQRALKQWTRRRDDGARESFSSSSFLSSSSLPYGGNGHGGNPYAAHGNSDCSRDHRDGSRNEKVQAMEELCARLQRWQSEMENRFGAPSSSATTIQATNSGHTHHAPSASVEARWQLLLRQRREAVEQLRSDGYGSIASSPGENVAGGGRARSISPPPPPGLTMHTRAASERAGRSAGGGAALPRAVKREELPQSQTTSAVKRERGSDFFDVDAIMTTRTRPRHGG